LTTAIPQAVTAPITRTAVFLVVTVNPGPKNREAVRSLCHDMSALVRSVGHRVPDGDLSCIVAFGSAAWDSLFGTPRPAELHKFKEIRAGKRHAVSTPGDILFHIRAQTMDLCFELATEVMARLGAAVSAVDEAHGFRFLDPSFRGGSYVITQKYLHDMAAWNALQTEEQEKVIGRTKLTDIELDDSVKPRYAHNAVSKLVENGVEVKILRDNMPFGEAGKGEFGTYFIGYSRSPRTTEKMLENMFVGKPPGTYDKLLDYSRAVTGGLFFAPSATFLEGAVHEGL
jgi:porphyrinogen peroxidase